MKNCEFRFFHTDAEVAQAAARQWLELSARHPNGHSVALSGGRIAPVFYAAAVEEARRGQFPLNQVHFYWADERCVPPEDPESNFRLANEGLFQPMAITPDHIHRIRGESDGLKASQAANAEIARLTPGGAGVPALDLVILGIGPDGHTASLMPNAAPEVVDSRAAYVYVDNSPKPPPRRITLTYAALAAARNVWALVTGAGKEEALRASLQAGARTPFGRVLESRGETPIFSSVPLS